MDWFTLAVLIAGLAAISLACRGAFVLFFPHARLPPIVQRALRFVPPAAFAALVAPELLLDSGRLTIGLDNPKLVAGVGAAIVAWHTKSALVTILFGMIMLHLVRYFL